MKKQFNRMKQLANQTVGRQVSSVQPRYEARAEIFQQVIGSVCLTAEHKRGDCVYLTLFYVGRLRVDRN